MAVHVSIYALSSAHLLDIAILSDGLTVGGVRILCIETEKAVVSEEVVSPETVI